MSEKIHVTRDVKGDTECGCLGFKATMSKDSPKKEPTFFLTSDLTGTGRPDNYINAAGEEVDLTDVNSQHSEATRLDGDEPWTWTFTLCPHKLGEGTYRVAVRRWKHVGTNLWVHSNEIDFEHEVNALLDFQIDEQSSPDLGELPCKAPLFLEPLEQQCVLHHNVTVQRVVGGQPVGPRVKLVSKNSGELDAYDLRRRAARKGFDFVPGQCYEIAVNTYASVNGSSSTRVTKRFCLPCGSDKVIQCGSVGFAEGSAGITIDLHEKMPTGDYSVAVQVRDSQAFSPSEDATYFNVLKKTESNFQLQHKTRENGTPLSLTGQVQIDWIAVHTG